MTLIKFIYHVSNEIKIVSIYEMNTPDELISLINVPIQSFVGCYSIDKFKVSYDIYNDGDEQYETIKQYYKLTNQYQTDLLKLIKDKTLENNIFDDKILENTICGDTIYGDTISGDTIQNNIVSDDEEMNNVTEDVIKVLSLYNFNQDVTLIKKIINNNPKILEDEDIKEIHNLINT